MEESQAINLLIQSVHKAQARGVFELMESYTLAAAVEKADSVAKRLQEAEVEVAKQNIINQAKQEEANKKIGEAAPSVNGEAKQGHEAPDAPELLKEISIEKEEKKEDKKK